MKIAFWTTSLPEPERKPGGVDVLVHRLANHLSARGHSLEVYTLSPAPPDAGYQVVRMGPQRLRYDKLGRMFVVPWVPNRIDSAHDIIHLHGDDWFFLRRRAPTVRTFYGSARDEARSAVRLRRRLSQTVVYRLERLAARQADGVYGLLPGAAREYGGEGALPCGVELQNAPRKSRRPTVLFVGTWEGRKRGRLLWEAFTREVQPAVPDARLIMVSDHAQPAPGVEHLARPTDAEVERLMAEAWVMCLPSSYEGFGIPYLEAMAADAAVVATNNPGAEHLLDGGRCGLITDEAGLGAAIVELLRSPERRTALAAAGRRRAEQFRWDAVVDLHEAAYERAVVAYRSPRGDLAKS